MSTSSYPFLPSWELLVFFGITVLVRDVHAGYSVQTAEIAGRGMQYRNGDKLSVKIQGREGIQLNYTLAPGYTDVQMGAVYKVHIFEHSGLLIPVVLE